jgi:hypothetical protein
MLQFQQRQCDVIQSRDILVHLWYDVFVDGRVIMIGLCFAFSALLRISVTLGRHLPCHRSFHLT